MDNQLLDLYTDYLICQNKYATATGLSDMLCGAISHDKVSRFLRADDYNAILLRLKVQPRHPCRGVQHCAPSCFTPLEHPLA